MLLNTNPHTVRQHKQIAVGGIVAALIIVLIIATFAQIGA